MKTNCKILVVDDDPSNVLTLKHMVTIIRPVEMLVAADGQEALELLDDTVDLIILDILLDDTMNGWELCAEIKKKPSYSKIPILIITALGDTQEELDRTYLACFDAVHVSREYNVKFQQALREFLTLC